MTRAIMQVSKIFRIWYPRYYFQSFVL